MTQMFGDFLKMIGIENSAKNSEKNRFKTPKSNCCINQHINEENKIIAVCMTCKNVG